MDQHIAFDIVYLEKSKNQDLAITTPFVSTIAGKMGLSKRKATKLLSTKSSTVKQNPP